MNKKSNRDGFTIVDELLVDLMGAVIPGFLFIIIIFVSIVSPVVLLSKAPISTFMNSHLSSGFYWVLLIFIVILSYVIGHIFYRADITEPDRMDINQEIKKEIQKTRAAYSNLGNRTGKVIKDELLDSLKILSKAYEQVPHLKQAAPNSPNPTMAIYACFKECCDQAIRELEGKNADELQDYFLNDCKKKDSTITDGKRALLGVLFPEEVYRNSQKNSSKPSEFSIQDSCLGIEFSRTEIKKIWEKEYRTPLAQKDRYRKGGIPRKWVDLAVCSCMLHVQIEIGCISAAKSESSYPYIYYYKYLLRRNIGDMMEQVTWNSRDTRSKNVINTYKTYMQLFVPEKYAIINKNESHIRMSSSTWHMTGVSMKLASFMFVITLLLLKFCNQIQNQDFRVGVALSLPLVTIVFCWFARSRIVKYIHYQRSREIFHAICAYDQCKRIIEHKKRKEATDMTPVQS